MPRFIQISPHSGWVGNVLMCPMAPNSKMEDHDATKRDVFSVNLAQPNVFLRACHFCQCQEKTLAYAWGFLPFQMLIHPLCIL